MEINKDNINEFIFGTTMDCSNKQITNIESIPQYITYLNCSNNKLTKLPKLPNNIRYLYCQSNKLINLPDIPNSLICLSSDFNDKPFPIKNEKIKEHIKLLKRKKIIKSII